MKFHNWDEYWYWWVFLIYHYDGFYHFYVNSSVGSKFISLIKMHQLNGPLWWIFITLTKIHMDEYSSLGRNFISQMGM